MNSSRQPNRDGTAGSAPDQADFRPSITPQEQPCSRPSRNDIVSSSDATLDLLDCLQTAKTAARRAGDSIVSLRSSLGGATERLEVNQKSGTTDLVTAADVESQRIIFSCLKQSFPNFRMIGEEDEDSHAPLTDEPTWIVDAIDGTTNYVHGLPDVAICIALALTKEAVLGVVYNPFRNEMFHAARGRGAYLNDRAIRVSATDSLDSALLVCEWGYDRAHSGIDAMLGAVRRLMRSNVRGMRQTGSGALDMCYVACGRFDGVYTGIAGEGWKIWDYAAAGVIAEEAGAKITDLQGRAFSLASPSMACATPGIASSMLSILSDPNQ